jgi:hypothetical protein
VGMEDFGHRAEDKGHSAEDGHRARYRGGDESSNEDGEGVLAWISEKMKRMREAIKRFEGEAEALKERVRQRSLAATRVRGCIACLSDLRSSTVV